MRKLAFEEFWEASSFNRFTIREFAAQQENYSADGKELSLSFPAKGIELPKHKSKVLEVAKKRRSERTFTDKSLDPSDIAGIMNAFRTVDGLEHRTYPSAGATYVTEIFLVSFNCKKPFGLASFYYSAERNSLVKIGSAPLWKEAKDKINITVEGEPQVLVLFVSYTERATLKYGERGGRFALIETGAAVQQLALTIAESKHLKGCAAGGIYDDYWLSVLGLKNDGAKIMLGYVCGI